MEYHQTFPTSRFGTQSSRLGINSEIVTHRLGWRLERRLLVEALCKSRQTSGLRLWLMPHLQGTHESRQRVRRRL